MRGSRAEGEHRQHLKLMSKQSEGLIEGQRKTQRDDALHEDPCVDLVCRKECKKRKICKRRQSADSHEIREPVPKHGGVSKARREVE